MAERLCIDVYSMSVSQSLLIAIPSISYLFVSFHYCTYVIILTSTCT